jgi:putative ABC transport system substrate-binding protein
MRRRGFIAGLSGVAAIAPGSAPARQPKTWRVGFLGASSAAGYARLVKAFEDGLKEYGYVEGKNLVIEFRWAEGKYDRLPALAVELCRLDPDVIVTHGTPGALAAERATAATPIVVAIVGDPITAGIVSSIRRPDKNITGSSFFAPQLAAKRVELLKGAMSDLRLLGILSNPGNAVMEPTLVAVRQAASALGVQVEPFQVRSAEDFSTAIAAMVAKRMEAVVVPEDGLTVSNGKKIGKLCFTARLPAIGFKDVAVAGGVMAYGVDIPETFRHAAYFVDKIFKGTRPQDVPIEEATKFEFIINLKAARELELTVPPTLLARADDVIE